MHSKQRISGPYFPSHSTSSTPHNQLMKEQLNQWCEELDRCDQNHNVTSNHALETGSKIIKVAPHTYM